MADATTPNYGWPYPTVNADANTWGTTLNNALISIDEQLHASVNPPLTHNGAWAALNASGYVTLPGGLMVQWGAVSGPGGTVTLPTAFPNECLIAFANVNQSGAANFMTSCYPVSASQIQVNSSASASYWISYLALGR